MYPSVYTGSFRQPGGFTGGVGCTAVTMDYESPVSLHEQLAEILRQRIASGELTSRVPSINTLAQEYGVSRRTSAHALTTLQEEGLIVAAKGKGFYVNRRR